MKGNGEQSQFKIERVPIDSLRLDDENPRLATATEAAHSQDEIVRTLWVEESVNEVADSIARNGFYEWEPLLVIPAQQTGKFRVIEGNRRLAAIRLLLEAELRRKFKVTELPTITSERRQELTELPCVKFKDRKALWAYLGFRHINGTKPWDSFSKAMYVAHVRDDYGCSLAEIADKIGDRHSTVQRLYLGYAVLDQAERQARFSKENRVASKFYFSHLYTAVIQTEYRRFLGLDEAEDTEPKKDPVPKGKLKELKEFMTWLYGDRSANKEPVVKTQAPDLNLLREVIAKPAALNALRAGRSLEVAHAISVGEAQRFLQSISVAKEELLQANATVTTGYKGDADPLETVKSIDTIVENILKEMHQIRTAKGKA